MLYVRATETFKDFGGGLEHLWVVCLVRKVGTFVFFFSVVLLIDEQDIFQLAF